MKILAVMRAGNMVAVRFEHEGAISADTFAAALSDDQIREALEVRYMPKQEAPPSDTGDQNPDPEPPPSSYEGGNERDILLAHAKSLGLKVGANIGVDKLKARIAEATKGNGDE